MTQPAATKTLAIDIGGTKFTIAVFEGDRMVERLAEPTDRAAGRDALTDRLAPLLDRLRATHAPDRCGVSFGGPVDFAAQRIYHSTHAPGWNDFDLVAWLRERLGAIPIVLDNDANAGALGEAFHGAGRAPDGSPLDPLFYMTLSTGIGGGIVSGGRLLRGADSYAGEIGHLTIRPDGPECLCGARGCLERLCCGLWLERDHGRPAKALLEDPAFVARYVVDLAQGLKAAIMLLNPARIVIGGGIAKAGDALFIPLRTELKEQITDWSHARIDVVPALHPDDCTLHGALELARPPE
jgi:glucokinase